MPQRAMPGMRTVQVAAETPESAHTWQRRMPQRVMQGMRTVQVAAETPETAHTWQQRASAMGKRRSCDGRPHRAVQNQAFCCTGRPRRTVRCRKWPRGVREARLSIGGCARRWQQEPVRRATGFGQSRPAAACSAMTGGEICSCLSTVNTASARAARLP